MVACWRGRRRRESEEEEEEEKEEESEKRRGKGRSIQRMKGGDTFISTARKWRGGEEKGGEGGLNMYI